jgi:hypothetical protein
LLMIDNLFPHPEQKESVHCTYYQPVPPLPEMLTFLEEKDITCFHKS